jgi:HK97 family phage major capsid protein
MKLRELLERRTKIVEEMRAITNQPTGDGGDLSAEQSTRFDALKTELAGLEKNIERQQTLDEAERRMQGTPLHTSGDRQLDDELRRFSLLRAIAMQVPDLTTRVDCGRERELSQELAKRSGMAFQGVPVPMQVFEKRVTTGATGADLISTDLMAGQYIDSLRAALVIRRLGARVLSGLMGNVDIPKRTGSSTAAWVADNAAISATDGSFDKVSMTPKHVGARTEFSRNMLLQSSPDIEALVRDDFAAILARAVDLAAIQGGGSNEPVGILETPNLNTVADASTWAKVLQLIETVEMENAEGSAWLTDPRVVRKLRSTAKVSSTDSVMIMQSPNELAGYPLISSSIVPGGSLSPLGDGILIFGQWSDLLLGYWSVFDLLVNPYESTAYSKGNVQVRGIITADVAVRHIESFAASTDVTV